MTKLSDLPALAAEWDTERNGVAPDQVTATEHRKRWWRCPLGHRFEAWTHNRSVRGSSCPTCKRLKIVTVADRPELAKLWASDLNDQPANSTVVTSGTPAWWRCENGHTWQVEPALQSHRKTPCRDCAKNDPTRPWLGRWGTAKPKGAPLSALRPDIANEWDADRNGQLTPDMVGAGSHHRIWWRCPAGHAYQAAVFNRTSKMNPSGCPYCANRQPAVGNRQPTFAEARPGLAALWHPTLNGDNTADKVTIGGRRLIRFLLPCGHLRTMKAAVAAEADALNCLECARRGRAVADLRPQLAEQWNWARNGDLSPSTVTCRSSRTVWWLCSEGHEWQQMVKVRASAVSFECPFCAGWRLLTGFNDLASRRPDIAAQWHPARNGNLAPSRIVRSFSKPVWWLCSEGHEWQRAPGQRTTADCPRCTLRNAGRLPLADTHPDLAAMWDPDRNAAADPGTFTARSARQAWWRLRCGHQRRMAIFRFVETGPNVWCGECAAVEAQAYR